MSRRFWLPLVLCLVIVTVLVAQVATPPLRAKEHSPTYTFQIIAQDGDVIDGRKLLPLAANHPAGTLLDQPDFSLNNSGQIAFSWPSDKGP